ncbi:conserved hypothetical protein [Desulfatibacillum aliphaticivorans]|uniref:SCP2 domain-containing protein n=1 Tax=Desulfatibacillum aliphaticivorans TaxID=218208 RepID=B8FK91_DESAL|nr:hypothetical protein [Desulfatibacillum aliphaticivorans]ACL02766.1 conserved hypothetical protein [Desulfatibacillum aliphaticivorans]
MATDRELLAARIYLRAVLPVMKVVLNEDPSLKKKFANVTAKVQFVAKDPAGDVGACLCFDKGEFKVEQGVDSSPDITFSFRTVERMLAMLSGKPAIPMIKGFWKIGLLIKVLSLLMSLKILMPDARPMDPEKKRLKVKLTFYMITTALSQYNKGGDPEMVKWTKMQPERIYQITVDDDIAAYLRVKAGKSKAGRGVYKRRRPFVHMKFNGVDGAFPIVMNDIGMVDAVKKGFLTIEGSPEYGGNIGDFMVRIQDLIT